MRARGKEEEADEEERRGNDDDLTLKTRGSLTMS